MMIMSYNQLIVFCSVVFICSDVFKSGDDNNSIESVIERLKNLQASSTASSGEREWSTKTLTEVSVTNC